MVDRRSGWKVGSAHADRGREERLRLHPPDLGKRGVVGAVLAGSAAEREVGRGARGPAARRQPEVEGGEDLVTWGWYKVCVPAYRQLRSLPLAPRGATSRRGWEVAGS